MLYMYMFWKDQVEADYYAKMGFPRCVGSMDVTHLMWKLCPSALRHVCTGRYHVLIRVGFIMFRDLSMEQLMTLL